MKSLDELVKEIVADYVKNNMLFTALDITNKVKETLPFTRHKVVRDMVYGMFSSDIEIMGYARTPIDVSLADGSTSEALLYHPLFDSWDLDTKYDAQRRSANAQYHSLQSVKNKIAALPSAPPAVLATTIAPPVNNTSNPVRVQWDQLFGSQPSLFPRK